jgi:hypothetical protein
VKLSDVCFAAMMANYTNGTHFLTFRILNFRASLEFLTLEFRISSPGSRR